MSWRIVSTAGLGALVVAAAFVFLHTGARADAVCERERFVPTDGLSLWPPGMRCSFGEPEQTDVLINPWWLGLLLVVALAILSTRLRHVKPSART
jgi:hypothetical protein